MSQTEGDSIKCNNMCHAEEARRRLLDQIKSSTFNEECVTKSSMDESILIDYSDEEKVIVEDKLV